MAEKPEVTEAEPTIAEDVVVTKYKMAGDMANRVLRHVLEGCVDGALVVDLCERGDQMILEETKKVYKKEKEMKKGIAFPTCVSLNNCICHFSPLRSDAAVTLKNGDLVKVELGVHVDGFIAAVGHTMVVGSSKDNKVTGRHADVIQAGYIASEIAHRMVVPGGENMAVTDVMQRVANEFNCSPVEGMMSQQLKKNTYDTDKIIILNPSEQQRRELKTSEFELHETYVVDILMSTGEGKTRQLDTRTTVFKRTEEVYNLKMKASRVFFSEVCNKFTVMPFTLRACEEEGKARMGVVECLNHHLVEPYNVLYEKEGELVAQFKFTVLLMPNGPQRITNGPFDQEVISSSLTLEDPDLKAILSSSTTRKNKRKKKKGKPGEGVKLVEGDKTTEEDAQDTKTTEAPSDSAS